jgi:hypothetical protein
MGIIKRKLAEFEISDGRVCEIELNADNTIHIHIGHTRIDLSRQEFDNFASAVSNARVELHKQKNW